MDSYSGDEDVDFDDQDASSNAAELPGSSITADGRFACECGKTFSRSTHLRRHARCHLEDKPFQCEVCGRRYARKDVLHRHMSQHTQNASSSTSSSRATHVLTLPRVKQACTACAKAKVRCSGTTPCGRCESTGNSCIYSSKAPESVGRMTDSLEPPTNFSEITVPSTSTSLEQSSGLHQSIADTFDNGWKPDTPLHMPSSTESTSHPFSGNGDLDLGLDVFDVSYLDFMFPSTTSSNAPTSIQTTDLIWDQLTLQPASQNLDWHTAMEGIYMPGNQDNLVFPQASTSANAYSSGHNSLAQPSTANVIQPFTLHESIPSNTEAAFAASALRDLGNEQRNPHDEEEETSEERAGMQLGLMTRAPSPVSMTVVAANADWPTSWNPHEKSLGDDPLPLSVMRKVHFGKLQDFGQRTASRDWGIEKGCILAILEILHFADIQRSAYHDIYLQMSKIPVASLNYFFDLYMNLVDAYIPFMHVPSFTARGTSGFLLAGIIAVGAQHCNSPAATRFSYVLGEAVQSGVANVVTANNTLNRSQEIWQSFLIWTMLRYTGVRRLIELSDVFRNAHTVALSKMHAFDGHVQPLKLDITSDSPLQRWKLWVARERRIRTGYACFLLDAEFVLFLDAASLISPMAMQNPLPCADALWQSRSAHDWATQISASSDLADSAPANTIFQRTANTTASLLAVARSSSFASVALVQMLHVSLCLLRSSGACSPSQIEESAANLGKTLEAIANGQNEFSPRSDMPYSIGWNSFRIFYHLAKIGTCVPMAMLLRLAGRQNREDAKVVRTTLINQMLADPKAAKTLALHAGQCFRLIRDDGKGSTYETFSLSFSALLLYVFARSQPVKAESMQQSAVNLDCRMVSVLEVAWTLCDSGPAHFGGHLLAGKVPANAVLDEAIHILAERQSWNIRFNLIRLLRNVVTLED